MFMTFLYCPHPCPSPTWEGSSSANVQLCFQAEPQIANYMLPVGGRLQRYLFFSKSHLIRFIRKIRGRVGVTGEMASDMPPSHLLSTETAAHGLS